MVLMRRRVNGRGTDAADRQAEERRHESNDQDQNRSAHARCVHVLVTSNGIPAPHVAGNRSIVPFAQKYPWGV
jgi:hypothetical protein